MPKYLCPIHSMFLGSQCAMNEIDARRARFAATTTTTTTTTTETTAAATTMPTTGTTG